MGRLPDGTRGQNPQAQFGEMAKVELSQITIHTISCAGNTVATLAKVSV